MEYTRVKSSSVYAVAYDQPSATLGVQFINGSEYHYFQVPESLFQGLLTASSVGTFLNARIKEAGFRYKRVK